MEFFTQEYGQALVDRLNNDEEFQKKASKLNTSILMTATDKDRTFILKFTNGKAATEPATADTDADFKLSGPYDVWVANHKGEAPLEKLIMTGKIKFKGSMAKILGVRSQLTMVDNISQTIDVEF